MNTLDRRHLHEVVGIAEPDPALRKGQENRRAGIRVLDPVRGTNDFPAALTVRPL
jgi:hypothetical protein